MAKKYIHKSVIAGSLVYESVYLNNRRDETSRRCVSKNQIDSRAAREAINDRQSKLKLELLIAQNFEVGDHVLTLTYDDAHLPKSRAEAVNQLKYFRKKLRTIRKKMGCPDGDLKMAWTTEHLGKSNRWHHHCIVNRLGDFDSDQIERAWIYGVAFDRPFVNTVWKNFDTLVYYMTKEKRDSVGERIWSRTQNLIKPSPEYQEMEAPEELEAPCDALVLQDLKSCDSGYEFQALKYVLNCSSKFKPIEEELIEDNPFLK
ncbi:MAG: rolling circle replication-associated protein [Candidatus Limivicinus sp.]|jgi:hypothetical protein